MEAAYCPKCERETGFQRKLGFGTFFAVLITCGFWLLALPFYPKRCNICGNDASMAAPPPPSPLSSPAPRFDSNKTCPQCAEIIKLEALKCRFCGEVFNAEAVKSAIEENWRIRDEDYNDPRFCPFCRNKTVISAMRHDGAIGPWCSNCQRDV